MPSVRIAKRYDCSVAHSCNVPTTCKWGTNRLKDILYCKILFTIFVQQVAVNKKPHVVINMVQHKYAQLSRTGMSIFSKLDLRSLARRGMAPAFRMACLFFVLFEQLHNAKAPQRATSFAFKGKEGDDLSWFIVD